MPTKDMNETLELEELDIQFPPKIATKIISRNTDHDTDRRSYISEITIENTIENISENSSIHETPNENVMPGVENDYPDGGLRASLVLLGSFLGLTANFGTLNSVGVIQTYLATHQLASVSASTISWIFAIYASFSFALTLAVGPYFDSRGALQPMLAGSLLVFGGLMATANSTTVWQFILGFSFCVGMGNALCISPLVGVVSHWFYRHIGLAIGLSSIGGSVGGAVIPLMLRSLYPKVGFVWAIRILAFFGLALNITAALLIKERFKKGIAVDKISTNSNSPSDSAKKPEKINYFKALKDAKFVFLVLGVTCGEISVIASSTFYGTYAIAQGMSESDSYILLTIFNAVGILGRSFPGYFSDRIGPFNIMIMMLTGSAVSILAIWLPFGYNHTILYVFIGIFGFTSSSILSLTPVCLRHITPVREFGGRYGLMYFFVSLGNLFGIPISSAIIGDSSVFHYSMFALFSGLITVLSVGFWLISRYKMVGFNLKVKV